MTSLKDAIATIPGGVDLDSATPYEDIRDYLNACPLIPNPESRGEIPKPFDLEDLLQTLGSPAEAGRVLGIENLSQWLKDRLDTASPEEASEVLQLIAALIDKSEQGSLVQALRWLGDNREGLRITVKVLRSAGILADETCDRIDAILSATIPDPNYEEQVHGPPRWYLLGLSESATLEQIQEAINAPD